MSIIDDVVQGISKEVNKVQERSQEMFQSFNLSTQVKDLERKKSSKLVELGRLTVDKLHHKKEVSDDLINEKIAEVIGYEEQINVLKSEIDALKVADDPNASTSKRAEAKAGFKPTPGFVCPHCEAPASKEKKFCPACGGNLHSKPQPDDAPLDVEPESEENGAGDDNDEKNEEDKEEDKED
ncbi:MAG: hypothetical protein K8F91_21245 [Candidatus Obscuribacterales bacterium]|nr:hypothetical protein [Candidatus Obscuribacterales bacterium]